MSTEDANPRSLLHPLVIRRGEITEGAGSELHLGAGGLQKQNALRYRCIVADPPWDMGKTGKRKSRPNQETKLDYPTMDTKSICALKAGDFAAPDAVLFLWTTHSHLEAAFGVMRSWGFRYQRCLTWDKANGMCLFGFHHRTEFCLFGYRGKLEAFPRQKAFPTVFGGASERHSAKPETFFDLVESYTPGPYLELFARERRLGWSAWGNEVQCDVTI